MNSNLDAAKALKQENRVSLDFSPVGGLRRLPPERHVYALTSNAVHRLWWEPFLRVAKRLGRPPSRALNSAHTGK